MHSPAIAMPTQQSGYVYQVDLTLRRWLDLRENHYLELERGEDIDLVSRTINASDEGELVGSLSKSNTANRTSRSGAPAHLRHWLTLWTTRPPTRT